MALIIVLILLAGALLAPGLPIGPSLDAAVFSHVGGRILDGVAPYVGAWDHKPPGIYLATAAAQALLGWLGPWTAEWLLSLAATVGLGAAVAAVLSRLQVAGWPRTLGAVGATILASHYLLALGGGLTEPPATALVAWALVLSLATGRRSSARLAGIGALVGLAALFSVQLLPAGLVVLALAVFLRPAGTRPRAATAMSLGFAAPLALVAAWLAVIGVLPAAFDAIVTYSAAYRASSGEYGPTLAAPVAAWTVLSSLFLVAPALLGAATLSRAAQPRRRLVIGSLVWTGASLALVVVQGRFYAHYAIPLAVPLGLLAGLGLERVRDTLRRAAGSRMRTVLLLPLVATLAISAVTGIISTAMQIAPVADRSARLQAVAERIEHLAGRTLLVWGNEPRLYDLSGRAPTTRYSYLYPLTTPGYSTLQMVEEVARHLAADPPAVVVDAGASAPGQPGFLPLLVDRPISTDGRDLDLLDPLRAFVSEHYVLVDTVAGWPIYAYFEGLQ
ncbi:MAG: hypothetical protein ABIS42_07855 [Candidatus Limnocylindria bacterium]